MKSYCNPSVLPLCLTIMLTCAAVSRANAIDVDINNCSRMIEEHDYKRASALGKKLVKHNPKCAICWHVLGLSELGLGDAAHARTAFLKAVSLDPHQKSYEVAADRALDVQIQKLMSSALARLHSGTSLELARREVEQAQQFRESATTHLLLSQIYQKLGDEQKSAEEFGNATKFDPGLDQSKSQIMDRLEAEFKSSVGDFTKP